MTEHRKNPGSFSSIDLEELLTLLVSRVNHLLGCERCTLFIHAPETCELWAHVASGAGSNEIRIPDTSGLAGECLTAGALINVPDAYADKRFNRQVDLRTGFTTRNILCAPIIGPRGEKVGVIQALNKVGGPFTAADENLLEVFSSQAAITLQNALAEEALSAARENERSLAAALAANHEKLQSAFRDLAAQKTSLEALMAHQRIIRRLAAGLGLLVVLIGIGILYRRSASPPHAQEASAAGQAVASVGPISSSVEIGRAHV